MAQILQINKDNNLVLVGMDDKTTLEVSPLDFDFAIAEGMLIDAYKHEDRYIFSQSNNTASGVPIPYGMKPVNKIPYALLFFFFGHIGIHEFYAGNPKKAFLWILGCVGSIICLCFPLLIFIPAVFICAIITFCKEADENGQILIKGKR